MSKKKKIYLWIIIIIIVVALAILFAGRTAGQKQLDTRNIAASSTPAVSATNGIPDNMSISNEIGG
ncbi:MAG: hypothetical protein WCV68_02700 [Candidatus Paceibacterota bacterium]|jgi:flagellar basal body-associated protein FliL